MAVKASDNLKFYHNPNGPTTSTVTRKIIEKDGLYFKDIDGTGEVSPVNDWRLPAADRAAAYVKLLTVDEKIGQLFISDWRMGPKYKNARLPGHVPQPDESGCLDEAEVHQKTIFGEQHLPGTFTLIKDWFARHTILRDNATPEDRAGYLNQLQAVAEDCEHFAPVPVPWASQPPSRAAASRWPISGQRPPAAAGKPATCARAICTWSTACPTPAGSAPMVPSARILT